MPNYKYIHNLFYFILGLILFQWTGLVPFGRAQETPPQPESGLQQKLGPAGKSKEPVYMNARQFEFVSQEKLYICRGDADVRQGDMRLRADEIRYYQQSNRVEADGQVIMEEKDNRLTGYRLEMDLSTKRGIMYGGQGFLAPSSYISGEELRLLGEDEFGIIKGSYSACDQEVPDWEFKVREGTVKMEDYAQLDNFTIYIRRYPVFWFPYMRAPVRTKRTSGFLFPQFGNSSQNGAYIKNRFFWNIAPWMDVTFGLDSYSKRGQGLNLEYRHAITEEDKALFNTTYIDDKVDHKRRWQVELDLRQHFDPGFYTVTRLDLLSDNQFNRNFSTDIAQRQRQVRDSYFWGTYNWDAYSVSLLGEETVDLYQGVTKQRRQPEIDLFAISQPVGQTPLWFRMDSSAVNLRRTGEETKEAARLNMHPQLYLPLALPYGITVTPQIGYRQRWYDEQTQHKMMTAGNYELGGRISGPTLSRLFDTSNCSSPINRGTTMIGSTQAVKHSVNPFLAYSYVQDVDQHEITYFDRWDRIPAQNFLVYGLENHFWSKSDQGIIRERLNFSLSQAYNVREGRGENQAFSPPKLRYEFHPIDPLSLTHEIRYNFKNGQIQTSNFDIDLRKEKLGHLNFGWRYTKFPDFGQTNLNFLYNQQPFIQDNPYTFWYTPGETSNINFIYCSGELHLTDRVITGAGINYNLKEHDKVESHYRLEYRAQCWDAWVQYINRFDSHQISFGITLKTFDSVKTSDSAENEQQ